MPRGETERERKVLGKVRRESGRWINTKGAEEELFQMVTEMET